VVAAARQTQIKGLGVCIQQIDEAAAIAFYTARFHSPIQRTRSAVTELIMKIRSPDGTTLNIRRFGQSPAGTLLLHGFGDGGFVWGPIVRLLQLRGSFIAPDLRGHGDSEWDPQKRYTPEVYAADTEHILQSLELRDLVVIGHSLGASIAIRLAARHPERVRHLVIVDGGPDLRREGLDFLFEQFQPTPAARGETGAPGVRRPRGARGEPRGRHAEVRPGTAREPQRRREPIGERPVRNRSLPHTPRERQRLRDSEPRRGNEPCESRC
jgi:pimeloyl-ACP methyl ester carboxylesterase